VITFEEEPVSAQTMAARLAEVQNASLPCLTHQGGFTLPTLATSEFESCN